MVHSLRLGLVVTWLFCLTLIMGLSGFTPYAFGQTSEIAEVSTILDKTQSSVTGIQERLKQKPQSIDDAELVVMRDTLQEAQSRADQIAVQLEPELTSVQARLKELGTPEPDVVEPADIAQQRAQLTKRQSLLDSQIKLARLLGVDARQGQDQISLLRRARFQAQLGERSQSLLTPRFWRDVVRDTPRDLRRLHSLTSELGDSLKAVSAQVWSAAGIIALFLLLGGEVGRRSLVAFTVRHTKPARLRRSVYAVLTVALYTAVPGLLATVLFYVVRWEGGLGAELSAFLEQSVAVVYLAGFMAGLGMVLLSRRHPTWRLPALTDPLAEKLAWVPVAFAITILLAWMVQRILELINAALSTTLLVNGIMTMTLNILIGFTAVSLRSSMGEQAQHATADTATTRSPVATWARAVPSVLIFVILVSLAAFVLGFIALSSLVAQEIIWLTLVGSTTYLLVVLVSDIFDSLVAKVGDEQTAGLLTMTQARARSQLLVLTSGALRLVLIIFAIALVLLPFGELPGDWLERRIDYLLVGFKVGEAQIRPTAIALTLAVLLAGIYAVKVIRTWISDQFLPVTRLDESMRTSTANLLSYLGYFAVVMMAVSSLGIGLERMAWIVSALSVGIGFGLQAVVQNFVSGVILVAERPIKVGDWVSLDGIEGNVRKINARATEIELFDRSTMIVPNSEFITKKVRNVTMADPLGVVLIKFNTPLDVNADVVRDIMMAAMRAQHDVLDKPAPLVTLEAFSEATLTFSATCYVISPRQASRMRSELMFDILGALRKRDITLQVLPPSTDSELSPPASSTAPTPPASERT